MRGIKHRITAPAGLRRIAAHAVADQTQPRGVARFGRQLQAAPGGQIKGLIQFDDNHAHTAVTQSLFHHSKAFGLILNLCQQNARRITEIHHALRKQVI